MSLIGRPKKGFNVIAYNAQKQRSKQMPNAKEHYFRDEEDRRTVVVTIEMEPGKFKAYVKEGEDEDLDVRGYGTTMMEAIADLIDNIKAER